MLSPGQTLYDNLISLVNVKWGDFQQFGSLAYDRTATALDGLLGFPTTFTPIAPPPPVHGTQAKFVIPPGVSSNIGEFQKPEEPDDPDIPTRELLNTAGPAPTRPAALNDLLKYSPPGRMPNEVAPARTYGNAPDLEAIAFDDLTPPDSTPVERPVFYPLDVPDWDAIDLPLLEAARPTIDFVVEETPFHFAEVPYTSALLDQTRARLSIMLAGGTGLPADVETRLNDRARTRENANALQAIQEARDDHAARGFGEPDGILGKRLQRVRQNNQNQKNTLSREIRLQNAQIEVENLRWAVAQGIALEQVLVTAHLNVEERRYLAARYAHEALNALLNARIALHNSEVEAYKADVAVWREQVEALLGILKGRTDLAQATASVNKALADTYEAEIRGKLREAEAFGALVNARRAKLEAQGQLLERWRLQIQAYTQGELGAYSAEWDAFAKQVQAKLGRVQAGEITARAYQSDVSAWATKRQADFEQLRALLAKDQSALAVFGEHMRKFLGLLEAERARMGSEADAKRSEASVMTANAAVRQIEADVINRGFQLSIEKQRLQGDQHMKTAEINLRAAIEMSAQAIQKMQTVAQVAGQLAASALSALNISAGLSGSVGVDTRFNYSGQI